MKYILYNPLARNNSGEKNAQKILEQYPNDKYEFVDLTKLTKNDILALVNGGEVIVTGGDGTLHRFANIIGDDVPEKTFYFYPSGSGNDFMNDIRGKKVKELVPLNEYLRMLPVIEVNGSSYRFVNGVGYGVDGYSCETVDNRNKATGKKKGSYSLEALKGLLYSFKAGKAKITVDGVTREYDNVWMVSAMNGRYFGGGVMIAPMQDRLNVERTVSVLVVSSKSRLRTLFAFPSIFKGKHMKYKKLITAFTGKSVSVEVDRPSALQIDGEVISGVTQYSVKTYNTVQCAKAEVD